jgi:uncharacterized protein YggE
VNILNRKPDMKKIALLIAMWVSASCAIAQNLSDRPFIAVKGEAVRYVVPDTFGLDLTLEETSTDMAKAQSSIETLARNIIALAKDQGVPDADLTVENLTVEPKTEFNEETEEEVFIGNTYSRGIAVQFNELPAMQAFLERLPVSMLLQIETRDFSYSKRSVIERELLAQAIKDARSTADEIAQNLGKKILTVHAISDRAIGSGSYLSTVEVTGDRVALLAPGTVFKAGKMLLRKDVYITYLIGD